MNFLNPTWIFKIVLVITIYNLRYKLLFLLFMNNISFFNTVCCSLIVSLWLLKRCFRQNKIIILFKIPQTTLYLCLDLQKRTIHYTIVIIKSGVDELFCMENEWYILILLETLTWTYFKIIIIKFVLQKFDHTVHCNLRFLKIAMM